MSFTVGGGGDSDSEINGEGGDSDGEINGEGGDSDSHNWALSELSGFVHGCPAGDSNWQVQFTIVKECMFF